MGRSAWIVAVFSGSLAACSCGGDDGGGAGARASGVIGEAGGTLVSSDGRLELRVPAGALDHEVEMSIEPGSAELPGLVGLVYRLGPAGTTFEEPVTLLFHFEAAALEGRDPQGLRVATSAAGLVWSCIPMSGTDEEASVVVAAVMHLSVWALRFHDCDDAGDCQAPEVCTETGVCGIPCTVDGDCQTDDSTVLSCQGGSCSHVTCRSASDCGPDRVCSSSDGPGVCLPACEARARCGVPSDQQICTPGAHCVFDAECVEGAGELAPGVLACSQIEGSEDRPCLHGWCIPDIRGCDCATEGCPCFVEGGEGEGEGEGELDITGVWHHRYNCDDAGGSCTDVDGCADTELVHDGGDRYSDTEGELTGQLAGRVLTWSASYDSDGGPYEEVGTWTFSADGQTFTQESCYAFPPGVADLETLTCSGAFHGDCVAAGSRGEPGPPGPLADCPDPPPVHPAPDCGPL